MNHKEKYLSRHIIVKDKEGSSTVHSLSVLTLTFDSTGTLVTGAEIMPYEKEIAGVIYVDGSISLTELPDGNWSFKF